MALSHFADLVNPFVVDSLVGIGKVALNKWLPVFLGNRPERVMTACTVKRPISIEHHFLNQMFAAAEEQITHSAMVLNHATQLPLHVVAAIFENLLKFIEYDDHAGAALRRDSYRRFQNFFQDRCNPRVLRQSKSHGRLAFRIQRDTRRKVAEEFLRRLEQLSGW